MGYRMDPAEKERRRLERLAYTTSLKPGDIVYNTWGYDQTNVDFYVVCSVSATGKTIFLRSFAARGVEGSGGMMCDRCVPDAQLLEGPIFKKPVRPGYQGGDYIPMKFGYARKWDGQPVYRSWYA